MSDQKPTEGMSLTVKTTCSWLKGFILLYGIHIILYGHLTPGGGFAGGVIAASAFLLILLAEGERAGLKTFSKKAALTWRTDLSGRRRAGTRGDGNVLRQFLDRPRVGQLNTVWQLHPGQ